MTTPWRPSRLSRSQLEERRLHFLKLRAAGDLTTQQLATHLGVSTSTIRQWNFQLRHEGEDALQATVSGGRPPRLTPANHDQLRVLLQQDALSQGFPDASWTTARVRDVIGRHFQIWYHADHVRKILHHLGFSRQVPDQRALEQDPQAVSTWVNTRIPELKKKSSPV